MMIEHDTGERLYNYGMDHAVVFVKGEARPWTGVISASSKFRSDAPRAAYFDGAVYSYSVARPEFDAKFTMVDCPDIFLQCLGVAHVGGGLYIYNQPREPFGLVYRVMRSDGDYSLHIIFSAIAAESAREYETITDLTAPKLFSFDAYASSPDGSGASHLRLDRWLYDPYLFSSLEERLYEDLGVDGGNASGSGSDFVDGGGAPYSVVDVLDGNPGIVRSRLPKPSEILSFINNVVDGNPGATDIYDGGTPTSLSNDYLNGGTPHDNHMGH